MIGIAKIVYLCKHFKYKMNTSVNILLFTNENIRKFTFVI